MSKRRTKDKKGGGKIRGSIKVALGIPHWDYKSYNATWRSIWSLEKPRGVSVSFIEVDQQPVDVARNKIVTRAKEADIDYLFFVDDDMIIAPDALTRLLSHQKDVVGGLTFARRKPYLPSIWQRDSKDNRLYQSNITYERNELIECDAIGMACTLIRMDVFDRLEVPEYRGDKLYFEEEKNPLLGEDMHFCKLVKKAGMKIFCDTSVKTKHATLFWVGEEEYDMLGWWVAEKKRRDHGIAIPVKGD